MVEDFSPQQSPEEKTKLPPPPPDEAMQVSIRTMEGDIQGLGKVSSVISQAWMSSHPFHGDKVEVKRENSKEKSEKDGGGAFNIVKMLLWGFFFILLLIGLFFLGYTVIPVFLGERSVSVNEEPKGDAPNPLQIPRLPEAQPTSTPTSTKPTPSSSFFRIQEGAPLSISVGGPQGFGVQLVNHFQKEPKGTEIFQELVLKNTSGTILGVKEFLALEKASLWGEEALSSLRDQMTSFVYRDGSGVWTGYVFQMKEDKTLPVVRLQVAKLESKTEEMKRLFAIFPGDARPPFADSTLSGQPVRVLQFPTSKTAFYYGWFYGKYLVISTSEEGMKKAVERL